MIKNLEAIYKQIQDTYNVSSGDFPDIKSFKEKLTKADFKKFKILDPVQLAKIDKLLSDDVAKLMEVVPQIHDESLHFNGFDGNQTPFGKTGE